MHSEPVYAAPAQAGVRGIRQQERERGCVRRCGQPSRQAADTSNVFENSVLDQLDAREIDMLRLLGEGKSYTQIAAVLGESYKTIANASCAIREKLAVETTAD
jgi:DNA-binding CsgD family transcriptional regulator